MRRTDTHTHSGALCGTRLDTLAKIVVFDFCGSAGCFMHLNYQKVFEILATMVDKINIAP